MSHRPRNHALAAVAVLVLLAASCSGSNTGGGNTTASAEELPPCPLDALDSAPQPVEVTVWHSLVPKQNDTLNELTDQYNASQSRVRVRMENVAASDEELLRRFQETLPTKDLPSILVANDTMTQQMVDSGVALPAQSCIDAAQYDMSPFEKTVVAYYTINGVMWAASANPGSALVFYNKDHFRRAGLVRQAPANLDEIRTDAEAIKAAGVVDKPFVHELASYKTEFWLTGATRRSSTMTTGAPRRRRRPRSRATPTRRSCSTGSPACTTTD